MVINKYILLFLAIFSVLNASAKQYPKVNFPLPGSSLLDGGKTAVRISSSYPAINSNNLKSLNNANRITSFENTVELVLKDHSSFDANTKITVTAELQYFLIDNATPVTKTISLEINFRSGELAKTDIASVYAFKNAYRVDVKVTNVTVTSDARVDLVRLRRRLSDLIELNIGFQRESRTTVDYNSVPTHISSCKDQETDELAISWMPLPDAESYELEYTFIDDYGDSYLNPLNPAAINFNFRENSTRVSLKASSYRFPLVYERGYILYRVRAVGRGGNNLALPVYCAWSGTEKGTVNSFTNKYYHNIAHMRDWMNWQSTSTFAEDGKRSDIVNYFDGTFRSRQTVTGMNLERQLPYDQAAIFQSGTSGCALPRNEKEREVIAGETIYDFQGRPAVNILPTPTNAKKIEYIRLLNISSTRLKPYNWEDFDQPNFTCPNTSALLPQPNATTGIMGAAAYYSSNNPNKLGFNSFIPDARGFPFTQLSYLQDNTGRVAAQSGVDSAFQFGKNHETRFYYAAPNQAELDRMFGTEVGDALRYKKNAVMDANHQVSVTYTNPEGKTIATALAGRRPDNLDSLDNQTPNSIDISLMSKNMVSLVDKTLITEHQFVVTTDNTNYLFNYSINPDTLQAYQCSGNPVCLDCIYNFEITLNNIETCNTISMESFSATIGNLLNSNGAVDLQCTNGTAPVFQHQISRTLGIGTYVITKKITVNQQAALAYIAEVLKDTCQAKWNEILTDELSHIDTTSCYTSCANCASTPVQTAVCDTAYCKPKPNRCDNIRLMMLADVSPGGQYAQFDRNSDSTIDASTYPLSIFNPANLLPVQSIAFGQFSPINNSRDLINQWRPEFAEMLLPMHPENCMLGWCNVSANDSTLDFDVQILSTQHFAEAVTSTYITAGSTLPNNNTKPYEQLLNKDPLFANGQNQTMRAALLAKLNQYGCSPNTIPADQLAMQMAYCALINPPSNNPGATPAMNLSGQVCSVPTNPGYFTVHAFGADPNLADREWTFLRTLYLSAKNEIIQQSMDAYANANNCNSRCIGAKDYYDWSSFLTIVPNFITNQPCQSAAVPFIWMLYKDKQGRFGSGMDNILNVMADAGINVNTTGVSNFNDPCQFAQAFVNQATGINQQAANTLCGGNSGVGPQTNCEIADSISALLTSIISTLKNNRSVVLTGNQLSSAVRGAGITGANAGRFNDTILQINLQPCISPVYIPYLRTRAGYIAPVSVCCISNIYCPGNGNCNFDLKILYSNNQSTTIRVNTKCNFLAGCSITPTRVCSQPTPYSAGIKKYLNDIFNFKTAYNIFPNQAQLLSMLPAALQDTNSMILQNATVNASGNFVINLGFVQTGKPARNCTITLLSNSSVVSWNNVKSIISIVPDLSGVQSGFTGNFILTALAGTTMANLATVTIHGNAPCWTMNQCPATATLCDSIPVMPSYPYVNNCVQDLLATARNNTSMRYHSWEDSVKGDLLQRYYAKCLASIESLSMKYDDKQYQYTLYYYDQAGNLVKTVPPVGVQLLDDAHVLQVATSRAAGYNTVIPTHHFKTTEYRYNTLNQVVWQQTPDAGQSNFYYDRLGRIVASQNAEQKIGNFFSYTVYDPLGRMVQSGKIQTTVLLIGNVLTNTNMDAWANFINSQPARTEITVTHYDDSLTGIDTKFGNGGQTNLRKRVASVLSFENKAMLDLNRYLHATHYRYDIEGNVNKLVQDYPNGVIGDKSIEYEYDLQSGKVNKVTYQRDAIDQFIHAYSYDAANRLTRVKTSTNGLLWETDAEYKYYRHGPLARMELGIDKVQGLDYMYTLQGWIKGVNGTTTTAETDMGQDGIITPPAQTPQSTPVLLYTLFGVSHYIYLPLQLFGNNFSGPGYGAINNPVARDAFGYVLDYYQSDYKPIHGNTNLNDLNQSAGNVQPLFNGNISRMYTQIQTLGNNGYNYTYDQLNRITSQHAWNISGNNNSMAMLPNDAYGGTFKYDGDGNILNQVRNGTSLLPDMDKLDYYYYTSNNSIYNPALGIPATATNKLAYVTDPANLSNNYTEDIDGQRPNNYQYNRIGNLISDSAEHITHIDWNLKNKIASITKSIGLNLSFQYDAFGNRVMKDVTGGSATQNVKTFYVRDAQGNIMATYAYKVPATGGSTTPQLFWSESTIYGSNRIGLYTPDIIIPGTANAGTLTNTTSGSNLTATRGFKQYELSNHLGNVLATISDRKMPVTSTAGITYAPELISGQDYYAFGMQMLQRGFSYENDYKFGFNGMEKDEEIKGKGNSYTTEYRIYDSRTGRWLSVDPKASVSPDQSPYSSMDNNPIMFNDPLGDCVGYEKFRDKVNVAVARIFSKTFNAQFKRFQSDPNISYTYKKRDDKPTLYEGPTLKNIDANTIDVMYSSIGPSQPPPPEDQPKPLKDRVAAPNAKPKSEFEAEYTITDFTDATLDVHTASYPDKVEIISKGGSILVKNANPAFTNSEGYTLYDTHINLKALYDAGKIDEHIKIKVTGYEKRRTIWSYVIKAKAGTQDSYSAPVKRSKVKE
ncbi:MAG: RHS repeat-associated core domain-containing protein [Bacteroidota bacterium]